MARKYELDRQVARSRSRIASAKAENSGIDGKIDRLTRARDQVDGVYQDCKGLHRAVDGYDVGTGWEGSRRERFERAKSGAAGKAQTYADSVNAVYDRIKDEIRDLNNRKNDNLGVIGDCEDVINDCVNALQKLVRDW